MMSAVRIHARCAALTILLSASLASAQSRDLQNATPLGPGVNTAAADSNKQPVQYFYFWAGPGEFKIAFTYKSMGMFGNPLHETLNFDAFNAEGKNVGHNAVQSFNKAERIETGGSYDDRRKVIIGVSPMKALIEVGGHYSIETSGAVSFDAQQPVRESGALLNGEKSLVNPQGALIHPQGPLVQSSGPLVRPAAPTPPANAPAPSSGSLVQPSGPLIHPSGPLVQPANGSLVHAGGPLVQPASSPLVRPVQVHETARELRIVLAGDVLFDFDSAAIRPDAASALREAADVMRNRARNTIRVEGHTDSKGTPDYNAHLSEARARSVEMWLVRNAGYAPNLFRTEAFGASHPVAPNTHRDGSDDPQGRQLNRRVEVVVAK